jgi:outer membrane biosynthesis protein TonB
VLARAASDALKKWKFNPFQDGGKPVKAVATLNFVFNQ